MTSNSISRKYQKLEQREHVLARPGMYVGSIEEESVSTWVYDSDAQAVGKREIRYVPALYKVGAPPTLLDAPRKCRLGGPEWSHAAPRYSTRS